MERDRPMYTTRARSTSMSFQIDPQEVWPPETAQGLRSIRATATQSTGADQIVVAHNVGLEMEVKFLRKENEALRKDVGEIKEVIGRLVAISGVSEVIELRDISYEDAKAQIKQYFEAHHGEEIDAADLEEALGIDIVMAIQICQDLEQEGRVKGV